MTSTVSPWQYGIHRPAPHYELRVPPPQALSVLRALLNGVETFLPCGDPPPLGAKVSLVVEAPELHGPVHAAAIVVGRRSIAGARRQMPAGVMLRADGRADDAQRACVAQPCAVLAATAMPGSRALDVTARLRSRAELYGALLLLSRGEAVTLEVTPAATAPSRARVRAVTDEGAGCSFDATIVPDASGRCSVRIDNEDERHRLARYLEARGSAPMPRAALAPVS